MTHARLHHVGYVVSSIQKEVAGFQDSLSASWDGVIFHDPLQKVRVTFLRNPYPADARIELVEPAAEDSPVAKFLERGGGLHHLCYEVPDLDQEIDRARAHRATLVRRPKPAVAFQGRRIAWILTQERLLVELLEAETASS